jgi:hypothetical protein
MEKLPKLSTDEQNSINFWRLSYASDHRYIDGLDCSGDPIIKRFYCEAHDLYEKRKKYSSPRSYTQTIINKYAAAVFRQSPERDQRLSDYLMMFDPAIRKAFHDLQVVGKGFLLLENDLDGSELSIAQAENVGLDERIVYVPRESVREFEAVQGIVISAVVTFQDESGKVFARRYYADGTASDLEVGKDDSIISETEPYTTGYSTCPLVLMMLDSESVQASPIAESQKTIANLLSLEKTEMYQNCFSRTLLSGLDLSGKSQEEIEIIKSQFRDERFVAVPAGITPHNLGSDVAQANSIRQSIKDEEDNLYRIGGLKQPDSVAGQSGAAKILEMDDYFVLCAQLTAALERAENVIISLMSDRRGTDFDKSYYSREYQSEDFSAAILQLRDVLSLNVPQDLKDRAIAEWAAKYFIN